MNDDVYLWYFIFQWFSKGIKTTKYLWTFVKNAHAYMNFRKLLNYQWMMVYIFQISFSMVFKCEQNYQNTSETFVKQVHAYVNSQKRLKYQWVIMYMIPVSFFNGLKNWSKQLKYLWNTPQTCLCIHKQLKTTKLPMKLLNYNWMWV